MYDICRQMTPGNDQSGTIAYNQAVRRGKFVGFFPFCGSLHKTKEIHVAVGLFSSRSRKKVVSE